MNRTPYYFRMHQGTGVGVRALLNDLPFYAGGGDQNVTVTGPANHLLVPGENVFSLELHPVPKPSFAPTLEGVARFALLVDEEGDGAGAVVHEVKWPELWEARVSAETPAEGERKPPHDGPAAPPLPFVWTSRFDVDERLAKPPYWDAPAADFGPEGTPGQHDAVRQIYRAFMRGDADAFLEVNGLKLEERRRAYPDVAELSAPAQRAKLAQQFALPWRVRLTEMKELVFERRASGRVAYVTRAGGGHALEAACDEPEAHFATDFFLTQHEGAWRVFR